MSISQVISTCVYDHFSHLVVFFPPHEVLLGCLGCHCLRYVGSSFTTEPAHIDKLSNRINCSIVYTRYNQNYIGKCIILTLSLIIIIIHVTVCNHRERLCSTMRSSNQHTRDFLRTLSLKLRMSASDNSSHRKSSTPLKRYVQDWLVRTFKPQGPNYI